jgi:hypothetical protein
LFLYVIFALAAAALIFLAVHYHAVKSKPVTAPAIAPGVVSEIHQLEADGKAAAGTAEAYVKAHTEAVVAAAE